MTELTVRRMDLGYFVRPGTETETGRAHVKPCLGYLVDLSDGALLWTPGWAGCASRWAGSGDAGSP
jgi:N-acyl homoserine lactone hydrolase